MCDDMEECTHFSIMAAGHHTWIATSASFLEFHEQSSQESLDKKTLARLGQISPCPRISIKAGHVIQKVLAVAYILLQSKAKDLLLQAFRTGLTFAEGPWSPPLTTTHIRTPSLASRSMRPGFGSGRLRAAS